MPLLRIAVAGAAGRMGRAVVKAVHEDPDTELAAAVDTHGAGQDAGELAGVGTLRLPVRDSLDSALAESGAQVLVDFTRAEGAHRNALAALRAGVSPVIGTTGLSASQLEEIRAEAEGKGVGAFLAPNFAVGAVLMMLFSRQAAKYLPEVEIIEFHGPQKVDAPSGTAMRTLEFIREGRGKPEAVRPDKEHILLEGARGGDSDGVRIHSVRLPGYVAHQECIFGGLGQTLTIRHDSTDRVSFMPGVLLACKRVRDLKGLVIGLEHLLEL
jgi:4-hydroxy-tetrahydrodipicolinate reductase